MARACMRGEKLLNQAKRIIDIEINVILMRQRAEMMAKCSGSEKY